MNFMTGKLPQAGDPGAADAPRRRLSDQVVGVVTAISGGSAKIMLDIAAMEALSTNSDPSIAMAGQVGSQVKMRMGQAWIVATVRTTAKVIAVERRTIRFAVAAFEGERKLGEGEHARGLINVAKFNARLGA